MRTMTFEEAMAGTVNNKPWGLAANLRKNFKGYIPEVFFYILSIIDIVRAYRYQIHSVTVALTMLLAVYPITTGLPFLEKVPNKFQCQQLSSVKMSNEILNHKISWKTCD